MEVGESLEETTRREAFEETGLGLSKLLQLSLKSFISFSDSSVS